MLVDVFLRDGCAVLAKDGVEIVLQTPEQVDDLRTSLLFTATSMRHAAKVPTAAALRDALEALVNEYEYEWDTADHCHWQAARKLLKQATCGGKGGCGGKADPKKGKKDEPKKDEPKKDEPKKDEAPAPK